MTKRISVQAAALTVGLAFGSGAGANDGLDKLKEAAKSPQEAVKILENAGQRPADAQDPVAVSPSEAGSDLKDAPAAQQAAAALAAAKPGPASLKTREVKAPVIAQGAKGGKPAAGSVLQSKWVKIGGGAAAGALLGMLFGGPIGAAIGALLGGAGGWLMSGKK